MPRHRLRLPLEVSCRPPLVDEVVFVTAVAAAVAVVDDRPVGLAGRVGAFGIVAAFTPAWSLDDDVHLMRLRVVSLIDG